MVDNIDQNPGSSGSRMTASGQRKPDPLIGTVVAERYRILELVGRGGMGVVYKARHELMERTVAVKMLLPQLLADENAVPRFQREARAASRINHPNIMGLHDFGLTEDGLPYLVMDYIEGESLADVLKRDKQVGVSRSVHIFSQVCDALSHAHELGIVHRDLKPGNIMLVQGENERDIVKVVDFGVAKMYESGDEAEMQRLTSTGELFGSPVYMSPEQCMGVELDQRSDIYALGCVMYETLTGKLPLAGRTVLETISRQLNSTPPSFADARPDLYIPEWLENAVFRCLHKDKTKRPQSMKQVLQELSAGLTSTASSTSEIRALSGTSMRMRAVSPENMTSRTINKPNSARNNKVGAPDESSSPGWQRWAVIAAATLALLGGSAFAFTMWQQSQQPKQPALKQDKNQPDKPAKLNKTPAPVQNEVSDATETAVEPVVEVKTAPPVTRKATPPAKKTPRVAQKVVTPVEPETHVTPHHVTHQASVVHTPARKKPKSDYYDFAARHTRNFGDPQALPVKEWSGD